MTNLIEYIECKDCFYISYRLYIQKFWHHIPCVQITNFLTYFKVHWRKWTTRKTLALIALLQFPNYETVKIPRLQSNFWLQISILLTNVLSSWQQKTNIVIPKLSTCYNIKVANIWLFLALFLINLNHKQLYLSIIEANQPLHYNVYFCLSLQPEYEKITYNLFDVLTIWNSIRQVSF